MSDSWFYRRAPTEKLGPLPASAIHDLLARGELRGEHEVWTQGMTDWERIDSTPLLGASPATIGGAGAAAPRVPLPEGLRGWMTFVAVMTLLGGAIGILSCLGLPSGVLAVVAGIALLGAKAALDGVRDVDASLAPFFQKLKLFMLMNGIVYILGLVITAVVFIVYFGVIMAALAQAGSDF